MSRFQHTKTLVAIGLGIALGAGSVGVASSTAGEAKTRTASPAVVADSGSIAGKPTVLKVRRKLRPVSPNAARANARRSAEEFFVNKGPYVNRAEQDVETNWNERGVGGCQKLAGGIRVRCTAWVGQAVEIITDDEVPYRTCEWWVESYRTRSGQVAVRDQVASRKCETLWF